MTKSICRVARDEATEYSAHLVEQIADILQNGRVDYVNTTPAVQQVLMRKHPDLVAGLDGVRLSSTQISAAGYRDFVAARGI